MPIELAPGMAALDSPFGSPTALDASLIVIVPIMMTMGGDISSDLLPILIEYTIASALYTLAASADTVEHLLLAAV